MFCTHCGTQIDEGAKFCKKCGAKLSTAAEPIAPNPMAEQHPMPAETVSPAAQRMPLSASQEKRGTNKSILIAAGVAVIVLAGAGVYFGTDMLRSPTKQETSVPPAATRSIETTTAPVMESKSVNETGESTAAPAEPPTSVEAPRPPVEVLSKPTGQQPAGGASATRPAAPSMASRGGATSGTYETLRNTPVHDAPSAASKVVANIESGIRISVVGSSGEWLEVHSKRGNPPGFIRRGDAKLVEASN